MKKKKMIIYMISAILFVIIICSISVAFINEKEKIDANSKALTTNLPRLYYVNKNGMSEELGNKKSIQSTNVYTDAYAKVKMLKYEGNEVEYSNKKILEDEGKYEMILQYDNEEVTKTFFVDNTAPIITGLSDSSKTQTVIFENISDVISAILIDPDENKIDLYQMYKEGKLKKEGETYQYQIEGKKGYYSIAVEDEAGNSFNYDFKLR